MRANLMFGDPFWHIAVAVFMDTPKERLAIRRKQKAFLARYARADMNGWANIPITALNEQVRAISELLQQETELARANEDR